MITPQLLVAIGECVSLNANLSLLRQRFPDLIFTECSEDDVSPRYKPCLGLDDHLLFLFTGSSGHCLEFTSDYEAANGIVVATRADED